MLPRSTIARWLAAAGLVTILSGTCVLRASAQEAIAQFYKGRTLTVFVGSSAGGGYDAYGRLVARYIGRYIPGQPSVVVSNMPGAASIVLTNHIANVAPQDGTQIAAVFAGALLETLLGDSARVKYDPLKLSYLGNAGKTTYICFARNDAAVKRFEDVFTTELVLGASADGGSTAELPALMNAILATRYKIIKGYPGSREITLAVEKGEVQGICGIGHSTLSQQYPEILTGNSFAHIYVQDTSVGRPDLNKLGIPTSLSFAKTAEQRSALDLYLSQNQFSRPFILGPGVPADRLAALRIAFADAMNDPGLLADAKKIDPEVAWSSGEEVAAIIKTIYATPAAVVEKVRKALGR